MKFLSSEKLSQHKYKTPEGYLICTDAILARTGKQTYRKCEVFADAADDESEIEIDRKAEEVFAPETLASFENKPITVEHPDENVTPDNYNSLSVGFVRDVHKGTVNGQDVMLGTLVITDARTIEEIENGEHTDLSCGYDCDIADEANPQQRNIRGNHVALCEQGRAGIARIVDSKIKLNYSKMNMHQEEHLKSQFDNYHVKFAYNRNEDNYVLNGKKDDIIRAVRNIFGSDTSNLKFYDNVNDAYYTESEKHDKEFVKNAIEEMERYIRNWNFLSAKEKRDIGSSREQLKARVAELRSVKDSIESDFSDITNMSDAKLILKKYGIDLIKENDRNYILKKGSKKYTFYVLSNPNMVREDLIRAVKNLTTDSIKDAPTPTTSGRDVSKYTLQSTADKNLFFYIGERYAMKEGSWTYQLYNLNDMTAEELLEDLKKSGWKQVSNRRTVIDSCDIKSYLEDQSKQESYSRLEAIPVQARQEMKNSSNKKATLLSIEGNIEDIINAAQPEYKNELKRMGDKIISDLKRQFNITDSSIYTITYTDNDTTHIIKIKAEDANKAFIKFRNKQK